MRTPGKALYSHGAHTQVFFTSNGWLNLFSALCGRAQTALDWRVTQTWDSCRFVTWTVGVVRYVKQVEMKFYLNFMCKKCAALKRPWTVKTFQYILFKSTSFFFLPCSLQMQRWIERRNSLSISTFISSQRLGSFVCRVTGKANYQLFDLATDAETESPGSLASLNLSDLFSLF